MKEGDKCKVRMLNTGEIVEAEYRGGCYGLPKSHFVKIGEEWLIAIGYIMLSGYSSHECRFVGNAGVRE